jgi:hypothetical protein
MCPRLVPGKRDSVAKVHWVGKKRRFWNQGQNLLIAGDAAGQP